MWYCSECGKKNNGKYCTRCGTRYIELEDDLPAEYPENEEPVYDGETGELLRAANDQKSEEEEANAAAIPETNLSSDTDPEVFFDDREEELALYNLSSFLTDKSRSAHVGSVEDAAFAAAEDQSDDDRDFSAAKLFRRECREESEDLRSMAGPTINPFTLPAEMTENIPETPLREEHKRETAEDAAAPNRDAKETETASAAIILPSGIDDDLSADSIRRSPFLRQEITEDPSGISAASFLRGGTHPETSEETAAAAEENGDIPEETGIENVFSHRLVKNSPEEKEIKYFKWAVASIGAIGVIVLTAFFILVGSLLNSDPAEEELPSSTGVYYYISAGDKAPVPMYADKSINSDVIEQLDNGTAVEYLAQINDMFIQVYDNNSKLYGFIRANMLVEDVESVDYGSVENQYDEEKSLGYFYVTKTESSLSLWENPDGGGTVKAKLKNGYKVSLLEKTNDSYWYVFDYNSAERGYIKRAFLTDSKNKVTGIHSEPKDKTVIEDYYITGVKQYLPLWSEPNTGSTVRAQLYNNGKIGLIQKTTGSFWYVYDYNKNVYGWVSTAYLTTKNPKAEAEAKKKAEAEAKAKAEAEAKKKAEAEAEAKKKAEAEAKAKAEAEAKAKAEAEAKAKAEAEAKAKAEAEAKAKAEKTYKVTGAQQYLPVTKKAESGSEEIGQLHNGDTVTVLDKSGDTYWYISTSAGVKGYVPKSYLTK